MIKNFLRHPINTIKLLILAYKVSKLRKEYKRVYMRQDPYEGENPITDKRIKLSWLDTQIRINEAKIDKIIRDNY